MGDSALPRWLQWAWTLHDWCPLWPHHGALLRTDGLDVPAARAGADLPEEMDPLEDWDTHPSEFELRLESITNLDPDFTRYIRQPTPGDLWLEERIKEHLAPLLKPNEPVKCAPPYDDTQESQWSPQCREARQAVIDSIERWIALPVPMPGLAPFWSSQCSFTCDRDSPRSRVKAIQLARTLRMQGKLWESVRTYQKANLAFGYSYATLLEEMDALSEAHLGTLRDTDMYWDIDSYDMTTLAIDSFGYLSLHQWRGEDDPPWDRILRHLSSFRPDAEPPHSLFTSCLSCLVALDNILLYVSIYEWSPQDYRQQLTERVRSLSLAACALIWQASERLRLRSKLFMRCRVILSFRRCQPRCDVSTDMVSACFNIGLDVVRLVAQDQETLYQLRLRLASLGDTIRPAYMQELSIIEGLRGSQDESAICSTLKALARYLDDMRATENTQAAECLISALLLYESPITASIHHRLRQLLWHWHGSPWYCTEPLIDYMAYHPLVIRVLAEIPPVPDAWITAPMASDAPRTPSRGPDHGSSRGTDHGSSTVAGLRQLGTISLFTTCAREQSTTQLARYYWLFLLWFFDQPEHSLLALHLVNHHYLFSRRQHFGRVMSCIPVLDRFRYFGSRSEEVWQAFRLACVRDRPLPSDPAVRIRALQAEKQVIGQLLGEISAILQSNAALPKAQRLSSCGIEAMNVDVHFFAADAQAELAGVMSGEAKMLALATARHEYVSALALAGQNPPSYSLQNIQMCGPYPIQQGASTARKHGELGLWRIERELLRTGSLIGGPPVFRITCLHVERTLREELYSHLQKSIMSPTLYFRLYHLQNPLQYEDLSAVYAAGRESALMAGDPVEALWWQQSGKAELTSASVVDRRVHAELNFWESDSRRSLPWASAVERVERLRRLGRRIQAIFPNQPGSQIGNRGISDIISRRRLDSSSLRAIFSPSDHLLPTAPRGATGRRVVWLDWVEETETRQYHLTFARFGETPIHLPIPAISPAYVRHWTGHSWTRRASTRSPPEAVSPLRDLDDLIEPLQTLLLPDDELVICPTGLLHRIPLHALHIAAGVPLVQRYPVLYATSLATYMACVSRSESPSKIRSDAAIAAIYRPQPDRVVDPDFDHIQAELHDILQGLSAQTGARFLWDAEVTPKSFTDLLQTHRAVLFCGHCSSAPAIDWGGTDSRLILHTGDLTTSDLFDCNLPSSLLVLIACGSSEQNTGILDEPMGLPTAALVAGAATVVGTMWPVRLVPAVRFIQRFLYWLGRPETKMDNGMINVARAVQHASLDVRERFPRPADWAGYVLHGSPVMRDMGLGQLEDPSSLIGGT